MKKSLLISVIAALLIAISASGQDWTQNPTFNFTRGKKVKYDMVGYRKVEKNKPEKVLYKKPLIEGDYILAVSCFKVAGKDTVGVAFNILNGYTYVDCPFDGFGIEAEENCTVKYGCVLLSVGEDIMQPDCKARVTFTEAKHNEILQK
jgi:hypothetical protein